MLCLNVSDECVCVSDEDDCKKINKKKSTFQDEDSGMAICGLGGSEDVSGMEMELVGGPEGSAFPNL